MKKILVNTLAAAFLLAVSAAPATATGGAADRAPSAGKAPFDRAFIDSMVPHHRSAIQMAKIAKAEGLSKPELVKIANDILRTQSAEIARMLSWRKAWYGSARLDPRGPEDLGIPLDQQGMHGNPGALRKAKDIDKAFAAMMIPHHEGAVTMSKLALKRGTHGELKQLARQIIAAQSREIKVLRKHAGGGGH